MGELAVRTVFNKLYQTRTPRTVTVKELVKKLKQFPPDTPVLLEYDGWHREILLRHFRLNKHQYDISVVVLDQY